MQYQVLQWCYSLDISEPLYVNISLFLLRVSSQSHHSLVASIFYNGYLLLGFSLALAIAFPCCSYTISWQSFEGQFFLLIGSCTLSFHHQIFFSILLPPFVLPTLSAAIIKLCCRLFHLSCTSLLTIHLFSSFPTSHTNSLLIQFPCLPDRTLVFSISSPLSHFWHAATSPGILQSLQSLFSHLSSLPINTKSIWLCLQPLLYVTRCSETFFPEECVGELSTTSNTLSLFVSRSVLVSKRSPEAFLFRFRCIHLVNVLNI